MPTNLSICQSILLSLLQSSTTQERQRLHTLFFLGAKSPVDRELVQSCRENAYGSGFTVSPEEDEQAIADCPVRRYFETRLAYHLMKACDTTRPHPAKFHSLLLQLYPLKQKDSEILEGKVLNDEFGGTINLLREQSCLASLGIPISLQNTLICLMQSVYLSWQVIERHNEDAPINIYGQGFFESIARGRTDSKYKLPSGKVEVTSIALGLNRPTVPLPRFNGSLLEHYSTSTNQRAPSLPQPISYTQARELRTFVPGSPWAKHVFKELVHPFSNSISGSFLFMIRTIALLFSHPDYREYVQPLFATPNDFILYFRDFSATLLYFSGGHSLREFSALFDCPEVAAFFTSYGLDLKSVNMKSLYMDSNPAAYTKALAETSDYFKQHLSNQALLQEYRGISASIASKAKVVTSSSVSGELAVRRRVASQPGIRN